MQTPLPLVLPPVLFGSGCASRTGAIAASLGASRCLIITTPSVYEAGLCQPVQQSLTNAKLSHVIFSQVEPEPSTDSVIRAASVVQAENCDMIIGLGGGSAMDTAKAAAVLSKYGGTVEDYFGANRVPDKGLPTLMLPTTAGTGSEVGCGAIFFSSARHRKEAIFSPFLLPDTAIIDPELTLGLPAEITASTGIDALCHAIESFTSLAATPLSKPYAREAVRLIFKHLSRAVNNGSDRAAREGMALGSLYAGISMANASTHAVHALAYPLQGRYHIPHGAANAVMLPHVLRYLEEDNRQHFDELYPLLDGRNAYSVVLHLLDQVGLPACLSAYHVAVEDLPVLADEASQVTRLLKNSPAVLSKEDILLIFKSGLQ